MVMISAYCVNTLQAIFFIVQQSEHYTMNDCTPLHAAVRYLKIPSPQGALIQEPSTLAERNWEP